MYKVWFFCNIIWLIDWPCNLLAVQGFLVQILRTNKYIQLDCRSVRRTRKINLPMNQKGYDNSETTVGKPSTRRIQIYLVYFCVIHFHLCFLKNFQTNAQTKIDPADLNLPRRILYAVPRSQVLLKCLGSLANCFFS